MVRGPSSYLTMSSVPPLSPLLNLNYPQPPLKIPLHAHTPCTPMTQTDARRSNEEGLVAKLWNPTTKAWFGDKGDGVHTGEPSDPRVAVLEVQVDEIRHFHQERTLVGTAVDVVASAISGSTATPGDIRTITREDISAAWKAGELKEP